MEEFFQELKELKAIRDSTTFYFYNFKIYLIAGTDFMFSFKLGPKEGYVTIYKLGPKEGCLPNAPSFFSQYLHTTNFEYFISKLPNKYKAFVFYNIDKFRFSEV